METDGFVSCVQWRSVGIISFARTFLYIIAKHWKVCIRMRGLITTKPNNCKLASLERRAFPAQHTVRQRLLPCHHPLARRMIRAWKMNVLTSAIRTHVANNIIRRKFLYYMCLGYPEAERASQSRHRGVSDSLFRLTLRSIQNS